MSIDALIGGRDSVRIAVVGHTNVGKTSLMRTLTRDDDFGEVASSPGTTRIVEAIGLRVGKDSLRFFDTPGLEDSSALLTHLRSRIEKSNTDWFEAIAALGSTQDGSERFSQEAKALKQVIASDMLIYVIDARDKVRAKHRDELEILMRCARPIIAVLNFTSSAAEGETSWRDTLARTNIHAIARFDTVVYTQDGEVSLYEKARTLVDKHAHVFDARITDIISSRRALRQAAAGEISKLAKDLVTIQKTLPAGSGGGNGRDAEREALVGTLRRDVLEREKACTKRLLELFEFRESDFVGADLPIKGGQWKDNPFDPDVLAKAGLSVGRAAATGAAVGLGVDMLVGGITLGAAAATGAVVGSAIDIARKHAGRFADYFGDEVVLKIDVPSLTLIIARQISLVRAMLQRGHGAEGRIIERPGQNDTQNLQPLLTDMLKASGDGTSIKAQQDRLTDAVFTALSAAASPPPTS